MDESWTNKSMDKLSTICFSLPVIDVNKHNLVNQLFVLNKNPVTNCTLGQKQNKKVIKKNLKIPED